MKTFDLRINGIFYREICGKEFEDALYVAGFDVDFMPRGNGGEVMYSSQEIADIIRFDADASDGLREEIVKADELRMTYGPAE